MLSYQHGYHAGNAADVHKHWVLCLLLEALLKKDTPFCYVDTHAGDGRYDLMGEHARKTGEYHEGIARLWNRSDLPASVLRYLDRVRACNPSGSLRWYPGSPALAAAMLREHDRAILLEAHPQAFSALRDQLAERGRIAVHQRDAFEGLPALVPPKERRGLVLLDPSYEIKNDYPEIPKLVARARERWPQGIYAVWYPILAEGRHHRLAESLLKQGGGEALGCEMRFHHAEGGMAGSGMVIVNPPWKLNESLQQDGPALADAMDAGFRMLPSSAGLSAI